MRVEFPIPSGTTESDFRRWAPSDKTREHPYPYFEALRAHAPIYKYPEPNGYGRSIFVVSSWDAIAFIMERPAVFRQNCGGVLPEFDREHFLPVPEIAQHLYAPHHAAHSDGVDHKIKRRWGLNLVQRDRLNAYRLEIANVCNGLIDLFLPTGECEFRSDFADVLPLIVLMSILGLPIADRWRIRSWTQAMMSVGFSPYPSPEAVDAATKAKAAFSAYVLEAVRLREQDPRNDLLSELLQLQRDRDGVIDLNFQVIQGVNLLVAGHHTTSSMLANAMTHACRVPGLMARIRADRSSIPAFLEESMRLESVTQWLPRHCVEDALVDGVAIPADSVVFLLIASGSRDDTKFPQPDQFRLERANIQRDQLAFGRGIHHCVGAPLARLEGVVAFNCLLDRLRNIHLDLSRSDLTPLPSFHQRGPRRVALTFQPS